MYTIQFHFVWVTKYRYHVLLGEVKLRTRELVRQICVSHDIIILKGHVSKDHVHILVSSSAHFSASYIMRKIKGRSSRMLQQDFPHLRKRFWVKHMWARGYFCNTVGQVTDEMIREYIARHKDESVEKYFTVHENDG